MSSSNGQCLSIHRQNRPFPDPVTSYNQLYYRVQQCPYNTTCTASTKDATYLHKKASKRIKTDWGSKENVFTTPGTTAMDINFQTPETTSTSETSDQEEEEASLQQQLRHQRRKQLKLRQRILKLLVQE